jgi:acylphosphatase
MIARRIRITGVVQGVFFRAWMRDEARRLGACGWARNADDGSVEAHVEGDEGAVAEMIARLHRGPSGAKVSDIEIENAEAEGLSSFDVRH